MAITYRMQGLFPGAVQRTHPCSVEPEKLDPSVLTPVIPGLAMKINATGDGVIPLGVADTTATSIYGVAVRPYPMQQLVMNPDGSAVAPPPVCDVLRWGYIGVKVTGTPVKGGPAYLTLATGVFATAAGGGVAGPFVNAHFNGPPDVNGVAELIVTEFQG